MHVKLIFPNIKILNVIIPNIGIFALILELLEYRSCPCKHWNYHVILQKIGILILSFQTLEFGPMSFQTLNTYLTHPNFGILALSFQTLKIHFQTFEFWPFPLKHSKTDLAPPNFGILAYILPIIVFIILDPSKHWNSYTLPNIGTPVVLLMSNIWIFILSFNWNIAFLILPSRTLEFPPYTYNH